MVLVLVPLFELKLLVLVLLLTGAVTVVRVDASSAGAVVTGTAPKAGAVVEAAGAVVRSVIGAAASTSSRVGFKLQRKITITVTSASIKELIFEKVGVYYLVPEIKR